MVTRQGSLDALRWFGSRPSGYLEATPQDWTAPAAAKAALKTDPGQGGRDRAGPGGETSARPHLARRGLQMVLRLLARGAEAWLAEHLNAYLADPDEYRAIARGLPGDRRPSTYQVIPA